MKKIGRSKQWVAALALLGVVGCDAKSLENGPSDEQGVEESQHALGWYWYHGGTGGTPYLTGTFLYNGVQLRYDSSHIVQIEFLGPYGYAQGPYGGGGGTLTTANCYDGYYIVGMAGWTSVREKGHYLNDVMFLCANGVNGYWLGGWSHNTEGTFFYDGCFWTGGQEYATQWYVQAGDWMDGIQMYCGPNPIIY